MSHLSPNELESLVQEADEAAGAGHGAVARGEVSLASRPAQEQPNAKRAKCAFAGDVDMPQAVSESYEKWAQWRDHMAATFCAFLGDDLAAKKAGECHVEVMHRRLDQADVDMATEWAAPSSEPYEALLMMALYENHARWRLDVVAGEWHHINPPASAPAQNAAPGGPPVAAVQQQPTDHIRAKIAALEARLSQLRAPSTLPLSLGELQWVANTQLHYAGQCQLAETLVIFLRTEAPQHGCGQSEVATALADGT